DNVKITTGITSTEKEYFVSKKITDPFIKIIKNALKEQLNILTVRKGELELWDDAAKIRFDKAFGFTDEKARRWILSGIVKEIKLNQSIPISNFIKTNENIFASVNPTDLEHRINIGKKFIKAPVTGSESQVVTLCHEMSHFDDILGTEDLGGGNPRSFAKKLADNGDERTMQSSYNFEMYFL
ncbi:hypothetical protein OY11_24550, partial [Salmonella enterica]|nr:hypothetical protein [Salmonella enterica]